MKIELQPFATPNYVIAKTTPRQRQDGWQEAPKWHLSDVDAESLSDLCDAFRVEIFTKAGKDDPKASSAPDQLTQTRPEPKG